MQHIAAGQAGIVRFPQILCSIFIPTGVIFFLRIVGLFDLCDPNGSCGDLTTAHVLIISIPPLANSNEIIFMNEDLKHELY